MSAFRGTNGHSVQGSSEDKVFQKIEEKFRKTLDEIVKEINERKNEADAASAKVDEALKKSIYRGTL